MDKREFTVSDELYDRAIKHIPGASQTLTKSAANFVRGTSPLFLERGEGCRVWDVDGNVYIDYVCSLLAIILGYRYKDVDDAIEKQLRKGITFSLATELETQLAERLVSIIPCAEMVRFAKNGSDVTAAAVRLARAATGRDLVVACGYHGWHDWYIGTTTRDLGVPEATKRLSFALPFNDLPAAEQLFAEHGQRLACVVMEPATAAEPKPGYLNGIRELCTKAGVILVFDEILSGFHVGLGGAQARFGVTPDLATFGKAMGNGMPIAAIVGQREIMRFMDEIFFSGTFGGETLSLAASLAVLDVIEKEDVPTRIQRFIDALVHDVEELITSHGLEQVISIEGPAWRRRFIVRAKDVATEVTTGLLRQELAANGILMSASFNVCLAHDQEDVGAESTEAFDRALALVARHLDSNQPAQHLRGTPVHPIFEVRSN